jgi:serine protease Do
MSAMLGILLALVALAAEPPTPVGGTTADHAPPSPEAAARQDPSEPEAQAEAASPKARPAIPAERNPPHRTAPASTPPARVAGSQPAVDGVVGERRAHGDDTPPEALHRCQQEVFAAALQAAAPCVVRIETIGGAPPVRRSEEGGEETVSTVYRQTDGPTTGVIWSADGYIVTSSFNFLRDPRIITATLADGRRLLATLVARDEPARLALLKVQPDSPLPVARPVERAELRVGQWALVGGFGFGSREPAMSVGVVSGLDRMAGLAVQTDARISPANYGGPLIDLEGRVIGVCVPMGMGEDELAGLEWYDSGISFAVTADRIERTIDRMKQGVTIRRGLMGVGLDSTDADERGVPIISDPVGPAAAAGLNKGDIITRIDAAPARTYVVLRRLLMAHAAGESIRVTYLRDGEERTADISLVAQDELSLPPASQPAP